MFRSLVEVVLPGSCPGCGGAGEPICVECAQTLRSSPRRPAPPGLDALAVAFVYDGVARELIARVKYRNCRGGLPWLAQAMLDAIETSGPSGRGFDRAEVVTWAPTTPARRRERGFDHAELLARAVARGLSLPVRGLLTRLPGAPQTGARRDARRAGPQFRSRPDAAGARVLLVDDVVTTSATFIAAAGALRRHGAHSVLGLAAARTP